ncbi:MAG: hypothetical protein WCL11_11275 [Verrucomicrobiota bacterium]
MKLVNGGRGLSAIYSHDIGTYQLKRVTDWILAIHDKQAPVIASQPEKKD